MPRKHRHEFVAYKITCAVDGRCYIGITTRALGDRWSAHKALALKGKRHPLYDAMREHGEAAFSIEHVASAYSFQALLDAESALIRQWNAKIDGNGYNITDGGTLGPLGKRYSDEEKAVVRDRMLRKFSNPEHRARHLAALHSPESKAKRARTRRTKPMCRNGHSLADAYVFPCGEFRCRSCSAEQYWKAKAKTARLPTPTGPLMFEGVVYKNLRAVALATGHSPSWATTNYRKGVITAA